MKKAFRFECTRNPESMIFIRQILSNQFPRELSTNTVQIALNEALVNAVRSGTRASVKISCYGQLLVIRIKDNGKGFPGNELVNKILEEGVQKFLDKELWEQHGRGIPLMLAIMDKVVYNHIGNEVMLIKRLKNSKRYVKEESL
ncbi:MAG: ATP-binding protein [Sporomusaceae bacterium]|nr:ATP-binding protein [Sporomusaceae bacterium]